METNNEKATGVINSLIEINNDRIDGYELAAKETDDMALKGIFTGFANDSREYQEELVKEVLSLGGEPARGTTTSGKFYRAWMDFKAAITGKDRKLILGSCEFGEDAALEAYATAYKSSAELSPELRKLIESQKDSIQAAHNRVKELRDAVEA